MMNVKLIDVLIINVFIKKIVELQIILVQEMMNVKLIIA